MVRKDYTDRLSGRHQFCFEFLPIKRRRISSERLQSHVGKEVKTAAIVRELTQILVPCEILSFF